LLYDTYGFPVEETERMAKENGLAADMAEFEMLMEAQRERARKAQKKEVITLSNLETNTPTKFVGFDCLKATGQVLDVVSIRDKAGVVLDTSCCYAEMGGQVGDTGELCQLGHRWRISNTQKVGGTLIDFISRLSPFAEDAPQVGEESDVIVDTERRAAIQRHHTVTHLFHWALHEIVSKDATQKCSYVGPDKLTFDVNSGPLTPQQIADIEKLVNERILESAAVS